jgi:hypothetical protein
MAQLRIFRVNAVPAGPAYEASSLYLVKGVNAGEMDLYVTNNDGTEIRSALTYAEADSRIATALSGFSNVKAVADIAARDALALTSSAVVMVADATADATVDTGAAMYMWNNDASTWTKIYEWEGMDATLDWANIQNKPTSTVAQIDAAVGNSHSHANKAVLDGISENGTTNNLVYNNVELTGNAQLSGSEW